MYIDSNINIYAHKFIYLAQHSISILKFTLRIGSDNSGYRNASNRLDTEIYTGRSKTNKDHSSVLN